MRLSHRILLCSTILFAACGDSSSETASTSSSETTSTDTSSTSATILECDEDLITAAIWFTSYGSTLERIDALFEFGQTHVVEADETRLAPPVVAERETLLLFTPDTSLGNGSDVRVQVSQDGTSLGVLAMQPPIALPLALEQGLTDTTLDLYSQKAWSAHLPWHWVQEGVALTVGYLDGDVLVQFAHQLSDLGAPHATTLSRTKIVLFSEGDEPTETLEAGKLVQDMFASVPGAELRMADYTPWRPEYFVVNSADGPVRVESESERIAITTDDDRWAVLKHQTALRHSLANTGRGLAVTGDSEGDDSPYSYGTSFAMGWVNDDGTVSDINNSPYSAGWSGWTAIWLSECDNTLIHEFGHSFELSHFTSGTSNSWGIEDEYPNDGQNMDGHPWGFDSTRRLFRTWYSVNSAGPVYSGGTLSGKNDPMNGGDAPNGIICYPQYTAYYAQEIQGWQQRSPTIMNGDDGPGVYQWNESTDSYSLTAAEDEYGSPIAVDVPVALLTGTLSKNSEASQTYPPIFSALGNVFSLADPTDGDLPSDYNGAQYFLEIEYADGDNEYALIAESEVTGTSLKLYSLTVDLGRNPTAVTLYLADEGYPEIDLKAATLLHSRAISVSGVTIPEAVAIGRGQSSTQELVIDSLCSEGFDCESKSAGATWRGVEELRHFRDSAGETDAPDICLPHDSFTTLHLPIVRTPAEGEVVETEEELVVYAQRVLTASGDTVAVPLNDSTPWLGAHDLEQSVRVWAPYDANKELPTGNYELASAVSIDAILGQNIDASLQLSVNLTVYESIPADLNAEYWTDPEVTADDSSVYFVTADDTMGPTTGEWWDGDPVQLTAPIIDQTSGEQTALYIDAYKVACDTWWAFNTGQSSHWNCDNYAQLVVDPSKNTHLAPGQSYQSPDSAPLIIIARRWHEPEAGLALATFALNISYIHK